MRLLLAALTVTLTVVLAAACSHAPVVTTPLLPPQATILLETSIGALETAAIALAPVDGISAADTATVVNAGTVAIQTIEAAKLGWLSALDVALNKIPALLSPATAATLQPYFDAIQLIITDLYSSGVV
jgi:hypothetical protein